MNYVLSLTALDKEKLVKRGRDQVKKYSWEKAASETLRVYESSVS